MVFYKILKKLCIQWPSLYRTYFSRRINKWVCLCAVSEMSPVSYAGRVPQKSILVLYPPSDAPKENVSCSFSLTDEQQLNMYSGREATPNTSQPRHTTPIKAPATRSPNLYWKTATCRLILIVLRCYLNKLFSVVQG
jgi:hypothetical protein